MALSLLSRCRYHAWVNVEALLEACFIGIVAAKQDDSEEEATEPASSPPPSPPSPPPAEPTAAASASPKAHIVWDEKNLAANDAERGVAYGTLKIDQPETPFLYGPASRPHRPPTASMAAHAARHVRCATRTDRCNPTHAAGTTRMGLRREVMMIPTWPSTASTSPSCGCRAVRMQKHPPLRRTARDDARWRSRSCRCCSGFSRRTRTARRSSKSPSTLPLATRSFRRNARCECEWSPALEAAQAWQARAHPYSHSQLWRACTRLPPSLTSCERAAPVPARRSTRARLRSRRRPWACLKAGEHASLPLSRVKSFSSISPATRRSGSGRRRTQVPLRRKARLRRICRSRGCRGVVLWMRLFTHIHNTST